MRLRCARCGCFIVGDWHKDPADYRVQPCKRCLREAQQKGKNDAREHARALKELGTAVVGMATGLALTKLMKGR